MYFYPYTHIPTHICTPTRIRTHTPTRTRTLTRTRTHTPTHTRTLTRIRILVRIRTCTCQRSKDLCRNKLFERQPMTTMRTLCDYHTLRALKPLRLWQEITVIHTCIYVQYHPG